MHRAVLTLLIGLMLSLGGAASALTFKSDGSSVADGYHHLSDKPSLQFRVQAEKSHKFDCLFSGSKAEIDVRGYDVAFSFALRNLEFNLNNLKDAKNTAGFSLEQLHAWKHQLFPFVGKNKIKLGQPYSGPWLDQTGGFKTKAVYIPTKFSVNNDDLHVVEADVSFLFEGHGRNGHVAGEAQIHLGSGLVLSADFQSTQYQYLDHSCQLVGEENIHSVTQKNLAKHFGIANKNEEKMVSNSKISSTSDQATNAGKNLSESSAELAAAKNESEKLREKLAALQAKQEEQHQIILADNQVPLITITHASTEQRKGIIKGSVADNVQVAEVLVDGTPVSFTVNGAFEWNGFVPATGKDVIIEAIDTAALASRQVVRLEREQIEQAIGPTFDDLNPMAGRRTLQNKNALALIVGISDYERTDAPAIYADKDAQYFHDYASLKLGIPDQNITTLVNDKAEQGDVFLAVADWMRRSSKPGKSDVYIFFAGHGLASQDGEQMYLLPYDGRPRLLDKTAILRDELFSDIAAANPRSVTVFLDTCYSGTTRGTDMLIASRPIAIRAKEQEVPEGFTVMTAAAGDQTAKPLEEAKHGMFSYFLMKGMEGDADANQDNQITAGELHAYVQQNVIQQSSGSQTPELQGNANKVLVRFQ